MKKKQRRSQRERTATTKRRLMDAAVDLLCEKGYANLTIDHVAGRVGVSRGAPIHHYSNKAALVNAVANYSCELAEQSAVKLTRRVRTAKRPVDAFVDGMAEYFFGKVFVSQLEILIASRTDAGVGAVMRKRLTEYRASAEKLWIDALRDSGLSENDAFWAFQLTLNILRGMGMHNSWKAEPELMKKCLSKWKASLRSLLKSQSLN
jgi:AcrR family transcriptional regulator